MKTEVSSKSDVGDGKPKDSWTMRHGKVVRLHQKTRKGLFTPHGVLGTPVDESEFTGERITFVNYMDGTKEEITDNFHTAKVPHMKLKGTWTGETHFLVQQKDKKVINADECEALIVAYEQDVLSAVAEGAQPSSVGVFDRSAAEFAALDEHAVPDTACRKTLVGEYTLLGMEAKLKARGWSVHRFGETNEFRFGNAGTITSTEVARIPIHIGRSRLVVNAAVLPGTGARTPLLFSKELLKGLRSVIDLENDELKFGRIGETVKLGITQRGHYAIPVLEASEPAEILESHDANAEEISAGAGAHEGLEPRWDSGIRRMGARKLGHPLQLLFGQHRKSNRSSRESDGGQVQESADHARGIHQRSLLCQVDSSARECEDIGQGNEEASVVYRMSGSGQDGTNPSQPSHGTSDELSAEASAKSQDQGGSILSRSRPGSSDSSSSIGRSTSPSRRRRMGHARECQFDGHRGVGAVAKRRGECSHQLGEHHCSGNVEETRGFEEEEGASAGFAGIGKAVALPQELSEPGYKESLMTSADVQCINESLERAKLQGKACGGKDILIITSDQTVDVTEIFSLPRVCKAAEACGLSCGGSYDILTGCDLLIREKREELRERLRVQKPKLLVVCPPCGPFCSLQAINKHRNMKRYLKNLSDGKKLLRFSMDLIDDQIDRGGLFLFEQPLHAKSWEDQSVRNVEKREHVRKVAFDQCMYGLQDRVNGKAHRKATGALTNSEMIAEELQKRCDKQHEHEALEGNVKVDGKWVARTKLAQEYPPLLVAAMIRGLLKELENKKMVHVEHCVLTVEALNTTDERSIVKMLRRCHENLGHPSTPRFIAMLKAARATDLCIKLAKGLTCSTCKEMSGQKSHNVAKAVKDMQFNDMVCVDTFEVELPHKKVKFLNVVDAATRYQLCVPLWKGIEVKRVRAAYRRYWKRWAGAPRCVLSDGGPEFTETWTDFLSHDGTDHQVTAAYAPWQNGLCERLGGAWKVAFAKAALEVDAKSKEELEEVTDQVNSAHNSLTRHNGHSPNQLVLGTEVRLPGLSTEGVVETLDSAVLVGEPLYVRSTHIREAARKAMLTVDSEDRLRRAAAHRARPNRGPFEPRDKVMIWRKGRQEKKAHWHGPACVVGVDQSRVFVAYGSKLYRCAPEQVRRVDGEIQELMEWLPQNLLVHRDSVRERGAGNIVELDSGPFPPQEERETNEQEGMPEDEGQRAPPMPMDVEPSPMDVEIPNEGQENADAAMDQDDHVQVPVEGEQNRQTSDNSMEQEPQQEPEGADASQANQVPEVNATGDQAGNAGSYGPVRPTRLTAALRRSLDNLDFGRPRAHVERGQDVMQVVWNKDGVNSVLEEVYVVNAKKSGRKEVSRKQLSPAKLEELEKARIKEWQKMITSGSIKVHRGEEAIQRKQEVGTNRILESRFVYTSDDGTPCGTLKARWCIRGYLDPDLMNLETASPTLSSEGLAISLQLIASKGWRMSIADIEAAFLRGDVLDRKQGVVLVRVPQDGIPGLDKGDIIELVRPVY